MSAMAWETYNLTGIGEPEKLDRRRVSANLFDLLGIQPRLAGVSSRRKIRPARMS